MSRLWECPQMATERGQQAAGYEGFALCVAVRASRPSRRAHGWRRSCRACSRKGLRPMAALVQPKAVPVWPVWLSNTVSPPLLLLVFVFPA